MASGLGGLYLIKRADLNRRLRNMTRAGEDVELDRLTPKGTRTGTSSIYHIS